LHQEVAQVKECDFVFSTGGYGTLLDTVRKLRMTGIPILGVNTGRLGFLANISLPDLELATEDLLKGTYKLLHLVHIKKKLFILFFLTKLME
jgi:NAD+ kinase